MSRPKWHQNVWPHMDLFPLLLIPFGPLQGYNLNSVRCYLWWEWINSDEVWLHPFSLGDETTFAELMFLTEPYEKLGNNDPWLDFKNRNN